MTLIPGARADCLAILTPAGGPVFRTYDPRTGQRKRRLRSADKTAPFTRPSGEWRIFTDFVSEHHHLGQVIAGVGTTEPIRVLEAGCGQRWQVRVPTRNLHITGVDLDADAMQIRLEETRDLNEAIVGDLRSVDLPPAAYDVAYCSFVLEHVEEAEVVLEQLREATRPGGLMIIRVPDRDSVYGFVVRHSPHRLHVLFKRYVEGFPDAGKPGHAPYPTVYDRVVSRSGLLSYADRRGLEVVEAYGSSAYLNVFGALRPLVQFVITVASRMSFGRLQPGHNNLGVVLRVPPA